MRLNFGIRATDEAIVEREAGTAQLGQHLIGKFAESEGKVADLLFALLGVFVHREDAEDDLLVLDVAGSHEFLEAVPVLCGVFGVDLSGHFHLLELLVDVV